MISVEFEPGLETVPDAGLLERAAAATQRRLAAPDADLTLVLAGDERLQTLNREFLQIDAPTAVLSFPAGETDPDTGRPYLGDVVISVPRAAAQAEGHPLEQELQLLVVHGVLHLLGHDHAGAEEKARMWADQAGVLESLGVPASIVHE